MLRLPPGTDLHDHPLVADGSLILQSKASCMPAAALAPARGWTVLDACAAPGNKTTHAAARVGRGGAVLAFDKDPKRLVRLVANAARASADKIISAQCADFLSLDPSEPRFAEVGGGCALTCPLFAWLGLCSRCAAPAALEHASTHSAQTLRA